MREARLIGSVNLVDRVFNKKGRVNPASNYQKPQVFTRTVVRFRRARLPLRRTNGDTRYVYFRRLMRTERLFIIYTGPIKGQLDGGRLICKVRLVKSRLPPRRRLKR